MSADTNGHYLRNGSGHSDRTMGVSFFLYIFLIFLFFNNLDVSKLSLSGKLSPKILVIKPKKSLSWQYHYRRSEIWSVIKGGILVSKSDDDVERELINLNVGEQIEIKREERHRIIGTNKYALVAEIWIHTDKDNSSDEEDIVRVQDDFDRK